MKTSVFCFILLVGLFSGGWGVKDGISEGIWNRRKGELEWESLSVQEKMMMLCKAEGKVITTLGAEKEPRLPLWDQKKFSEIEVPK